MRNAVRILKTTGIPARHSLAHSDGTEWWPGGQQAREGSSSCFSRCQQPQLSAILPPRLCWAAPLTGWLAGWLAGWQAD